MREREELALAEIISIRGLIESNMWRKTTKTMMREREERECVQREEHYQSVPITNEKMRHTKEKNQARRIFIMIIYDEF